MARLVERRNKLMQERRIRQQIMHTVNAKSAIKVPIPKQPQRPGERSKLRSAGADVVGPEGSSTFLTDGL